MNLEALKNKLDEGLRKRKIYSFSTILNVDKAKCIRWNKKITQLYKRNSLRTIYRKLISEATTIEELLLLFFMFGKITGIIEGIYLLTDNPPKKIMFDRDEKRIIIEVQEEYDE